MKEEKKKGGENIKSKNFASTRKSRGKAGGGKRKKKKEMISSNSGGGAEGKGKGDSSFCLTRTRRERKKMTQGRELFPEGGEERKKRDKKGELDRVFLACGGEREKKGERPALCCREREKAKGEKKGGKAE